MRILSLILGEVEHGRFRQIKRNVNWLQYVDLKPETKGMGLVALVEEMKKELEKVPEPKPLTPVPAPPVKKVLAPTGKKK